MLADTDSCLVVGPQWLGDAVMAQPLLADLARRGPVDVLSLAALAPVYQAMPGVRRVWPVEWTRGKLEWSARRALAQTFRSEAYPRAVVWLVPRYVLFPVGWQDQLINPRPFGVRR